MASSLNSFASENYMSVYEIGEALDVSRVRVADIEAYMNTFKQILTDEFKKEASIKQWHKEEIQKELQLQKYKFYVIYEKRDGVIHILHQEEI